MDNAHRMFRVDELLREIFEQLDPLETYCDFLAGTPHKDVVASARATLFSAALCCRSFCEPALDVLWRWQQHPDNLLQLLPMPITRRGPPEQDRWAKFDKHAKRVRVLTIPDLHSPVSADGDILSDLVVRLPNLRTLLVRRQMSFSAIQCLSSLTNLRELDFKAGQFYRDGGEQAEPVSFLQLRSAGLEETMPSINSALRLISFPYLQDLRLIIMPTISHSVDVVLSESALDLFRTTLRSLTINGKLFPFADIRPILTLRHLQHVQFGPNSGHNVDIADEDLCEMARAWPNLTKFVFDLADIPLHRNSLPEFARCCPRLQTLRINLWFDSAPSTDNLSPSIAKLTSLTLEYVFSVSDIGDIVPASDHDKKAITDFVTTLFPHVRELNICET